MNLQSFIKNFSFYFLSFIFFGCAPKQDSNIARIFTDYGTITIRLYDDTPLHRANFIRLINNHFYDGLLFHRVIEGFIIQGGDPQSCNAAPGQVLGEGGLGYTLPAEIRLSHFHKRGAIAAAREGDQSNPFRRSSSSQFYIVHGRTYSDEELDKIENYIRNHQYQNLYIRYFLSEKQRYDSLKISTDASQISIVATDSAEKHLSQIPSFSFTPEQRAVYKTIGGAPHLDGSYTIFGEVIDGMEVVDKIASVPKDVNDRPLKDIHFKIKIRY